MSKRTEKILFMLMFMFVGAVICFLVLALLAGAASAAPVETRTADAAGLPDLTVAAAKCTPTSWQAKVAVHGVRCRLGRCTGSISSCGSWGCAYGSVSGSSKSVYEGLRVWATVKRSAGCGYSLRVGR